MTSKARALPKFVLWQLFPIGAAFSRFTAAKANFATGLCDPDPLDVQFFAQAPDLYRLGQTNLLALMPVFDWPSKC